jgi:signal transduction histidine kinase/ligand-binding sensor domain-containing protein
MMNNGYISRNIIYTLIWFVVISAAAKRSNGQTVPNEKVDIWLVEDGLPQHTVNSIVKTTDGFLWIGTEGGLARFDGFRFKTFDRSNTPVLTTNRVRALGADSKNRLYIGTLDGGIGYYENHQFHFLNKKFDLGDMTVNSIVVDNQDRAWFSSYEQTIRCFDGDTVWSIPTPYIERQGITNLLLDGEGVPYAVHTKYFLRLDLVEPKVIFEPVGDEELRFAIYDSATDALWLLTTSRLLKITDKVHDVKLDPKLLFGYRIRLIPDIPGRLILSINDQSIAYDTVAESFVDDKSVVFSEKFKGIKSSFIDEYGNRWFGSLTEGLIRLRPNAFRLFESDNVSTSENAIAIYKGRSGTQWVSYQNESFYSIDPSGRINKYSMPQNVNRLVYSFFEDAKGDTYLGSFENGIYRFDDGKLTQIPFPDAVFRWVYGFFEDKDGFVWILTRDGLFHLENGSIKNIQNLPSELLDAKFSFATQLWDGSLVFSAEESLYKLKNNEWSKLWDGDEGEKGFFRGIVQIDNTRIVAGTYGNGLLVLDLQNGESKRITSQHGLHDNVVSYLYHDKNQNLWMSGNNGLTLLTISELDRFLNGFQSRIHPALFNKKDGSPTNEFHGGYQNSALILSDSDIVLPSINGFVHIDLKLLQPSETVPDALIDNFIYGSSAYYPNGRIQLPYKDSRLEFVFTAPYFESNAEPVFRYMLQGYDETWNETGSLKSTVYPRLEPGEYSFILQSGLRGGIWNSQLQRFTIEIVPPFHKSVLFKFFLTVIALGFVALGVIVSIRMYNTQHRRRFKQVLDAQESERRRIAADLHDSVGQSLSSVKMMLNYAQHKNSGPDTIRDMIVQSQAVIDSLADEIRTISNNLAPASLKKFGLETAMEEQIRKVQIDDKFHINFIRMMRGGELDESLQLAIFRIFQELLANSIKHANASEISVQLIEHDDDISFTIEDDGVGFDFQKALSSSSGNGLHNIISRVSLIGGKLQFDSSIGSGTTVTIQIPTNGIAHD